MISSANDYRAFFGPRRNGAAARRPARKLRRGQSLVEFAVVALVVYMLLAAILTFGHALYVAQGLQTAADLGAREISRTPLPASSDFEFEDALANDQVRRRIFDEAYLVIDLEEFYGQHPDGNIWQQVVPEMPALNQQLSTLMIVDRSEGRWLLRYPGALVVRTPAITPPGDDSYSNWVATGMGVNIPLVDRDADGGESVRYVPVVEEIEPADSSSLHHNPFLLTNEVTRGVVALRINYPFQSASMSSFRENDVGPFEPTIGSPNLANEADSVTAGTYAGADGLGVQLAFGQRVRPYRRVISAQAIYRREIFE